jgi:hypothetical protein
VTLPRMKCTLHLIHKITWTLIILQRVIILCLL